MLLFCNIFCQHQQIAIFNSKNLMDESMIGSVGQSHEVAKHWPLTLDVDGYCTISCCTMTVESRDNMPVPRFKDL